MNLSESTRVGIAELSSYKLRSTLTILGIIFGVAAVIAMVSIGEGARYEAVKQIEVMGTNNIRIHPLDLRGEELARARQKGLRGLTTDDVETLRETCPTAVAVTALAEIEQPVKRGRRYVDAAVIGTDTSYLTVTGGSVVRGRFLLPVDTRFGTTVCVLGSECRRQLFGLTDPIGKTVLVGDVPFSVVGVMEDRRKASGRVQIVSTRDLNRDVYIPVTTIETRFFTSEDESPLSEIGIRIDSSSHIHSTAALIRKTFERTHKGIEDFEIMIPDELLRQSQKSQRIFNIVMGCIAGISLVVGGIGIMNIMLATVTQRTREIGVRRSLGARRQDILIQFLIEAVILALTGGVVGILLGVGAGYAISVYAEWVTIISPLAVILAFGVAAGTGLIFGLFPARKAANLDPIDALRHE